MKRTWTAATLAVALGCTATIFGQAGAGTTPTTRTPNSQPGTSQQGLDAHRTIKVIGCVQRAGSTPAVTGTSGSTAANASKPGATASTTGNSLGWILADARTDTTAAGGSSNGNPTGATNRAPGAAGGTQSAAATPLPPGAGGGANRGMSGTTYILEPSTQPGAPDLAAHNGHKVEVTGTLAGMPNANGVAGAAAAGAVTGSTTDRPSSGSARATTATAQTTADATAASQRIQVTSVTMISQSCS
jgi:hypothetical protein